MNLFRQVVVTMTFLMFIYYISSFIYLSLLVKENNMSYRIKDFAVNGNFS